MTWIILYILIGIIVGVISWYQEFVWDECIYEGEQNFARPIFFAALWPIPVALFTLYHGSTFLDDWSTKKGEEIKRKRVEKAKERQL